MPDKYGDINLSEYRDRERMLIRLVGGNTAFDDAILKLERCKRSGLISGEEFKKLIAHLRDKLIKP